MDFLYTLYSFSVKSKPISFSLTLENLPTFFSSRLNRLFLECTQRHVTARVEHFTGKTVVLASTKEWAIKQHLFSTTDINAVRNIGHIIAQRCLQSGISELHTELQEHVDTSEKVIHFMVFLHISSILVFYLYILAFILSLI